MTRALERLREGRVLFDGAVGTMLIARGLALGRPPEAWNLERAEIVRDVHLAYLEAGAEVVTANTFGATPSRLAGYGLGDRIDEINRAGVSLARRAVSEFNGRRDFPDAAESSTSRGAVSRTDRTPLVALSLGPTGKMLPPVGTAAEDEIRDEFAGQIRGVDALYDLVVVETMYDLREALIALGAVKQLTEAPVAVTLTYEKKPRGYFTIMGDPADRATRALGDAGADAAGANCTLTSADMLALGRVLRDSTSIPVLCQPNAGKPRVKDGILHYQQAPGDFARDVLELFAMGINAVGGCCGTTPAFIHEVSVALSRP